jgi:hypothetical protein
MDSYGLNSHIMASTSFSFSCLFQMETHIDSNHIVPQSSTHASTTIKAPAFATSKATIFLETQLKGVQQPVQSRICNP